MRNQIIPSPEALTPADHRLLAMTELEPEQFYDLARPTTHYLGKIMVGTTEHEAARFHCGPENVTFRGGTKLKGSYASRQALLADGGAHSRAMFDKIGALDETSYAGGKTIVDVDPRTLSRAERESVIDQLAGLIVNAGLANPKIDGTAGDEGTNDIIGTTYVEGLRRRRVKHPEACVTGKPDMPTRPAATGRGAAIALRTFMRLTDDKSESDVVVQGAGFAGAYFAAEAYEPREEADRQTTLAVRAIGDINPETKKPQTLHTTGPKGLPITHAMVNGILVNPGADRDMQNHDNNKLAALAAKIKRTNPKAGIILTSQDVLTYDPTNPDTYLVPAATSHVIREDNARTVRIKDIAEIGNGTIDSAVRDQFNVLPGEILNAGGVAVSIQENRRDLERIKRADPDFTLGDAAYEAQLYQTMQQSARRAYTVAERFGVDLITAVRAVSLANYALSKKMPISREMHEALGLAA